MVSFSSLSLSGSFLHEQSAPLLLAQGSARRIFFCSRGADRRQRERRNGKARPVRLPRESQSQSPAKGEQIEAVTREDSTENNNNRPFRSVFTDSNQCLLQPYCLISRVERGHPKFPIGFLCFLGVAFFCVRVCTEIRVRNVTGFF